MADLVRARSKTGTKREFWVPRRLVQRYPDRYVLVKSTPEKETKDD